MPSKNRATPTGWDIQGLTQSPKKLHSAYIDWLSRSKDRAVVGTSSSQKDLDKEVCWIEKNLAQVFDTHAKILRVTSYSKRWLNNEVAEARKIWAKAKKKLGTIAPNRTKFKEARNLLYWIV